MRLRHLALSLLLFVGRTAAADGLSDAAEAAGAFDDRDFKRALVLYTRALDDSTLSQRERMLNLLHRATVLKELKDWPKALADLDRAAAVDRDFGMRADNSGRRMAIIVMYDRGVVHESMGRADLALMDYSDALKSDPEFSWAYLNRGNVQLTFGHCDRAEADYQSALAIAAKDSVALNNRAWVLATCPEPEVRDGAQAITLARQALAIAYHPYYEGVLAAALAENGQLDEAIATQVKAMAALHPDDHGMRTAFEARLQSYKAGKPWRHSPAAPDR